MHSLVAAVILEKLACALASSPRPVVCEASDFSSVALLEYLNRALEIRHNLLGPLHVDTVENLATIAAMYMRWEHYSNAQETYSEVLLLRRAIFGCDRTGMEHPSVAVTAHMLGQVHARLSQRDKAVEYFQMAERIYSALKLPTGNPSFVSLQRDLNQYQ